MSERTTRIWSWIITAVLAATLLVTVVGAPSPEVDRARAIGARIRCPVCQGESIADSPSETARNMMSLIEQRIDEGLTDSQIIDQLLASYSGALLLDPPMQGATLWLWLAPVLALSFGVVLIGRRFREAEPSPPRTDAAALPTPFRRRWAIGGTVLAVAAAATLVLVGQFRQGRLDIPLPDVSPAQVSNETMEAVIASNLAHPEINEMRLALANRYFEQGEYQRAFPHYQAVLETDPDPGQAAIAYSRLGWMVYDGNGEVALGLELIDQALDLVPDDAFAIYLKGRMVWCGQDDPSQAIPLFESVMTAEGLDDSVLTSVAADLDAARAGARCS
ncbi:MAG: cytochrome c-type biogenesis protein CcmH [Actinomycetota bacterium]